MTRALCFSLWLSTVSLVSAQDVELPSRESPALFRSSGPAFAESVRRQLRAMRPCYERALARSGDVPRGTIRFVIERTGRTSKVRFTPAPGESADRELERCLIGAIRRMRFDPRPDRVEIAYPVGVHAS
jgi:hypothetical protein